MGSVQPHNITDHMVSSIVALVNVETQTAWSVSILNKNRSIRIQTKIGKVKLRKSLLTLLSVELILRQPLLDVRMGGKHEVVVVQGEVW